MAGIQTQAEELAGSAIRGAIAASVARVLSGENNKINLANSVLTPDLSKYKQNRLQFPGDIFAQESYHNHAMLININVHERHNKSTVANDETWKNYTGASAADGQSSKIDLLKSKDFVTAGANPSQPTFGSRTYRIKESILLYMPNVINYEDRHGYQEVSLTSLFTGGVLNSGGTFGTAAQVGARGALNPRIELLYTQTSLRHFRYDFLLNPSNEKESQDIYNIFQTLRYHASPESTNFDFKSFYDKVIADLNRTIGTIPSTIERNIAGVVQNIVNSILFLSPSTFDITFYHNGEENTKIPRISTCALEAIDLDTTPTGVWTTFSNGFPVSQRLTLTFREMEVMTKARIAQGF